MSDYTLANKFQAYRNGIAVVGCGGTGGFAAEGLCRLLLGSPGYRLVLIDGDRVEDRNLGRQSYYPEELGRFKSQALAERLARRFGGTVAYSVSPLGDPGQGMSGPDVLDSCALVVGCVDNPLARAAIGRRVTPGQWWLDAGNGAEHGQLLVGNVPMEKLRREGAFDPNSGLVHLLPLPSVVRPELLLPAPRPADSCADAVATGEQGPTINQLMAALVVEMVRRLLERRLAWWQLFVDLESGDLRTVIPTPEAVSRLTGIPVKKLERR